MKKIKRTDTFLLLSVFGISLLIWAFIPGQSHSQTSALSLTSIDEISGLTLPQSLAEARQLVIEAPDSLRPGETGVVRLLVELDPQGENPAGSAAGEEYNAMVESRLEGSGGVLVPSGTQEEPLRAQREAVFTWQVTAQGNDAVETVLWAYIDLVPAQGGDEIRWPVLSKPITIPVVSILGLPISTIKIAGIGFLVLGLGLAGYSRFVLSSLAERNPSKKKRSAL